MDQEGSSGLAARVSDLERQISMFERMLLTLSGTLDQHFKKYDVLLSTQQQQIVDLNAVISTLLNDQFRHSEVLREKLSSTLHGISATSVSMNASMQLHPRMGSASSISMPEELIGPDLMSKQQSNGSVSSTSSTMLLGNKHVNSFNPSFSTLMGNNNSNNNNNNNGGSSSNSSTPSTNNHPQNSHSNNSTTNRNSVDKFSKDGRDSSTIKEAVSHVNNRKNAEMVNVQAVEMDRRINVKSMLDNSREDGFMRRDTRNGHDKMSQTDHNNGDVTAGSFNNVDARNGNSAKQGLQQTLLTFNDYNHHFPNASSDVQSNVNAQKNESILGGGPLIQNSSSMNSNEVNASKIERQSSERSVESSGTVRSHSDLPSEGEEEQYSTKKSLKRKRNVYVGEFQFLKSPHSVLELWKEYTEGINGQPSIKELESVYQTGWRRDPAVNKRFSRRKVLYKAIETGLARGYTLVYIVDLLEDCRFIDREKGVKRPLGWLFQSNNIPDILR